MDEFDLTLVNAIQLRPRASWAELAGPLGVDPATLSRRWARMFSAGEAWVTCHPGPSELGHGNLALVEVKCAVGSVTRVAEVVARDAHAFTVDIAAGARDLYLQVAAAGLRDVSAYVVERIGGIDGVTNTRLVPVTQVFRDASRWRIDSLDSRQRAELSAEEHGDAAGARERLEDRALILALAEDGRMSYSELSARAGLPESTARRRVAALLGSGRAVLRGEIAHRLAGWKVQVMLWLSVPPARLEAVAGEIARLPESRMCAAVIGEANLALIAWTRQLSDVQRLESALDQRFPDLRVLDRTVSLRQVKRIGRLLDDQGRAVALVPLDIWADPVRQG